MPTKVLTKKLAHEVDSDISLAKFLVVDPIIFLKNFEKRMIIHIDV